MECQRIEIQESPKGVVAHLGPDSEGRRFAFSDIRAAISPPGPDRAGYYLVLGRSAEGGGGRAGALHLVVEGSSHIGRELIGALAADVQRFLCPVVYAARRDLVFFHQLHDRLAPVQWASLIPAEFVEDEANRVSLIRQYLAQGVLRLPRAPVTLLRAELEKMTADDDSLVLGPLSYLLVGFSLHPQSYLAEVARVRASRALEGLCGMSRAAWEELQGLREEMGDSYDGWD